MKSLRNITLLAFVMLAFAASASAQITVTATGGTMGPTPYTTLGGAGGAFAAINAGTHQGDIIVNINANVTEAAAAILNGSGQGSALYTSVLIRPTADGLTISGPTVTGRGLIELNGADSVTIDGDNAGSAGTNRNLTITNTALATTNYTMVIRVAAFTSVITSANNNTIRNLTLNGSATGQNISTVTSSTGPANTTYGVYAGATGTAAPASATTAPSAIGSTGTTLGSPGTITNLIIDNNAVNAAARAVAVQGSAATVATGLQITNNFIGAATPGVATTVYSMGITAQGSSNGIIRGNTVNNVESFLSANLRAIDIGAIAGVTGDVFLIERNTAANVISRSTTAYGAYGIQIGSGTGNTVQNNFIYGMNAVQNNTAYGTLYGSRGIRVSGGTNHRFYHNSVNLFGALLGTGPDVSSCFTVTGTGITGMDVRNNIFANSQTGSATSTITALQLPSAATSAINLTLNNNLYYNQAVPAANQYLLSTFTASAVTTNYTTANFNPAVPTPANNARSFTSTLTAAGTNDNASLVGDPLFTSNTNLLLQAGSPARNVAANVGVANDFEGQTRPGLNAFYDIGADEFDGVTPPANDIAATAIVVPASGSAVVTGTTVTPQATFTNVGTATQTGVQVTFTITGPGGYSYTDTQTIATIAPNQTVTVTFAVTTAFTTAGTYTSTATVTTVDLNTANDTVTSTFNVFAPITGGSVNVGTGEAYTSLTNPGGIFAAINAGTITSNITVNITTDLTGETGSVALNQVAGGFTVTIVPSLAARTITGTATAARIIALNGADNVTIDGSLSGGTDRSLTIINPNTAGGGVILIGSLGVGAGATNNTVKNTNIQAGSIGTTAIFTYGISVGNASGAAVGQDNDNVTIQNNLITRARTGIQVAADATGVNDNLQIVGNTIGDTSVGANSIGRSGIVVQFANDSTISTNTVRNVFLAADSSGAIGISLFTLTGTSPGSTTVSLNTVTNVQSTNTTLANTAIGMFVGTSSNTNVAQNNVNAITSSTANPVGLQITGTLTGSTFTRNNITNIFYTGTGGYGGKGIDVNGATNGVVSNNFVSDIRGDAFGTGFINDTVMGIRIIGATTGTGIYNNSVCLCSGTFTSTQTATVTAALYINTTGTGVDIRNNILSNNLEQTGTNKSYAFYAASLDTTYATDYNDYFVSGAQGVLAAVNVAGTVTDQTTLADLRTATADDANSISADPMFVSATDLHIAPATGTNPISLVSNAGTPIASVPNDYDGNTRSATAPDIGADEFTNTAGTVPAGIYEDLILDAGTTLGGNVTINGSLTLNGVLGAGTNTLTISCTGTFSNASATNYVDGTVAKIFCDNTAFTFPVGTTGGDNPGYSPVVITPTGTAPTTMNPATASADAVDATLPGLDASNNVSRYWTLNGTGFNTFSVAFTYLQADVIGTNEENFNLYKTPGPISVTNSDVDDATNTATATGQTGFSDWGIGNLIPSAASVNIGGQVTAADGRGVSRATVTLTDSNGNSRTTLTSPFGYYTFEGIEAGQTVTVTVGHKQFVFANPTLVFNVSESVTNADFISSGVPE